MHVKRVACSVFTLHYVKVCKALQIVEKTPSQSIPKGSVITRITEKGH